MVPIGELKPHPRNPNRHPHHQIKMLAALIEYHGWRAPIAVSTRSGFITRGHGRLEAAKKLGLTECPVDFQDYCSDADELADILADNRVQDYSELDMESVDSILTDLSAQDLDIDITGFSLDEIDLMTGESSPHPKFDEDDFHGDDEEDNLGEFAPPPHVLERKTSERKKRTTPSFRCPKCGYDSLNDE